jgi:GH15 family glucan-1,4-alpha-glucosidase
VSTPYFIATCLPAWSETLGSFRQRYEAENLDAAELLISVMGFLPGDHPRVLATVERIAESLSIDGFVYRRQFSCLIVHNKFFRKSTFPGPAASTGSITPFS